MAYKGPSSFNFVNVLLVLLLAAGAYGSWKFLPHYYTAWQVDRQLAGAGTRAYKINQMSEPGRSSAFHDLEDETRKSIAALGVDDPQLEVNIAVDPSGQSADITADYTVVVEHPRVKKQTVLKMHRSKIADLTRTNW